jgi:hypothetical protein
MSERSRFIEEALTVGDAFAHSISMIGRILDRAGVSGKVKEDVVGHALTAASVPTVDPVALAAALAGDARFVTAIASDVASRLGMIPTAREIGNAVVDAYAGRLTLAPVVPGV